MRDSNANNNLHKDTLNLLTKQIEESFEHKLGPGSLPPKKNKLIPGMIVPHDNYELAGPAMAWSYFSLGKPEVFIIFGVNHQGNKTCLMQEPTNTPFGIVRVDQNLARELLDKGNIEENLEAFSKDKKIDAQLPFIQYMNKSALEKIKILPILIANDANIEELSVDIKEVLAEQNKTAVFICVTNLTNYGSKFKYAPYVDNIRKQIYETDAKVLDFIKSNSFDKLQDYVEEKSLPIFGLSAIKFLLNLIKPKEVQLQQYYTSGDLNDVDNPSIAYASMLLE